MRLGIYAVLDRLAGAYGRPFTMPNDWMAQRAFVNGTREPGSDLARNPEDFELFCLGYFDDVDGCITAHARPELLLRGTPPAPVVTSDEGNGNA